MIEKQRTIKNPVSFKGKGLHSGKEVNITIKPADVNIGYKFIRTDLEGQPSILAVAENVVDTSRGTVIANKDVRVSTIEHLLASLSALQIDNVEIEIDGSEVPILDGSARYYIGALNEAGFQEQSEDRHYFEVTEKIVYKDATSGSEIVIYPDETTSFDVRINYDSPFLRNQYASLHAMSEFASEIAPCRTFCFFREIEQLAKMNLIKGGDLDNAIVIVDHQVTHEEINRIANLFGKPEIKIEKQGVLNNIDLRFDNEPARHKLLDLIGDLALLGLPLKGRVIATMPGHRVNTDFAKSLRPQIKRDRNKVHAPKFDLFATPKFDIEAIKGLLPHRYPFLLVDKIMSINENEVVGIKNVTFNEAQFLGHFPKEAVMPGVLQIEALAQCGGILVLHSVPDPENYSTYFVSIDKIKFRRMVKPGDILTLQLTLLSPIRRGIAHMRAMAFVGDQLATEGEMMAQVIKK